MLQPAGRWRMAVAALFLTAQVVSVLAPAGATAQASQKPQIQKGQEYYEQSRFDEAISLLKDMVDRGALTGEDLQKARELLARSYVKKGYPVQAKEMFKAILRDDPTWRPDPIRVPPDETAVFDQSLKEYQEEKPAAPPPGQQTPPPTTTTPTKPVSPETIGVAAAEKKPITKQWWFWTGLGVLAVGGIAAAVHPPPPPPPPPNALGFPAPPGP